MPNDNENITTTAGLKTTEFWLVLSANIAAVALAMFAEADGSTAAIVVTILTGVYALLRSAIKNNVLNKK